MLLEWNTGWTFERPVEEVTGIKLNARLCGKYLHFASTGWRINLGGQEHRVSSRLIQHKVVIISPTVYLVDTFSDTMEVSKVEGSSFYGSNLAGGNQILIHGRILIGVELHLVV